MSGRAARSRNPLSPWLVACLAAAASSMGHQVSVATNSPLPFPEPPSVEVLPPQCNPDSFPMEAFLDTLRVELAGTQMRCCSIAERGSVEAPSTAWRIELESAPCSNTLEQIHIKARSPGGIQLVEREISLGDVAQALQPRTLALVAAELIRTVAPSSREDPREPVKPQQATARALPRASSRPVPAKTLGVHLEATSRHLPPRDTTFWGGRARWSVHRGNLHASLDWGAEYAHARATLGDLHLSSASLGLGVGPRFVSQAATLDLGIRAELGMLWVRGSTGFSDVRIESGSAVFSNLGVWGALQVPAQFKLRPELTVEAGGVMRGVDAQVNRQTVAGMAGYYMLIALGITMPL